MPTLTQSACQFLLACSAALPLTAQAGPTTIDIFFDGAGTQQPVDPTQGTGNWSGKLMPGFGSDSSESLISSVMFKLDADNATLKGSFEFSSLDMSSTLTGLLTGSDFDGDGQFEIDYQILGGSGAFNRASGYGLSFISFDQPLDMVGNYSESGLLTFAVPEPTSYGLVGLGLLAMGFTRRKPRVLAIGG